MHPFITQALASQRQASLLSEAEHERLIRHMDKRSRRLSTQQVVLNSQNFPKADFAAIRSDLRSTLTEWCLEAKAEGFEEMIDTFMQRLEIRLGQREQHGETRETEVLL